jgi:hypothetical protein
MTDNDISELIAQYRHAHPNDADVETFLRFLRDYGCSQIQSIKALMIAREIGLAEAKGIMHRSSTWADRRAHDDAFHARLEDVLRELADEDTSD